MNDTLQLIVEGAEMPSVPTTLQEIIALARDPNASSKQLENLIAKEPGLVTHILKTVNSAYYGFSQQIGSLSHGIVLLGFSTVKSIASGLMLIDTFNNLPGLNKNYMLTVWQHSLFCAGLMKKIAEEVTKKDQEELFLATMVHNVGHLVLAQHFGEQYNELLKDTPFPSMENEQQALMVNHAEAGGALIESWKFPEEIVQMVSAHHQAEMFTGNKKHIFYLQLCDLLARNATDLDTFLNHNEKDLIPPFLDILEKTGWSWSTIQEKKNEFIAILAGVNQAFSL